MDKIEGTKKIPAATPGVFELINEPAPLNSFLVKTLVSTTEGVAKNGNFANPVTPKFTVNVPSQGKSDLNMVAPTGIVEKFSIYPLRVAALTLVDVTYP